MAAAEAVTLPMMCGIGGEVFALLYHAASGTLYGVSRLRQGADARHAGVLHEQGLREDAGGRPADSCRTRRGARVADHRRPVRDALAGVAHRPGHRTRVGGLLASPRSASYFSDHYDKIAKYESTAKTYIRADGSPYRVGDVFAQPNLARSLRRIAQHGPDEFYHGALAREIAQAMEAGGGLIDEADLAAQETSVYENPPSARFHGHTVYATGLPSQGMLTLELLSLLDGFDLAAMGHTPSRAFTRW